MSVAARTAAYGRYHPSTNASSMGNTGSSTGSTPGVPILVRSGLAVNMSVQFAWGASITMDSSQWTWTDVTTDVQYAKAVSITIGRSDESANPQPAQALFTLDNRKAAYSYGPVSPNFPNVKRNVPCRISLWYQGVQYVRFFGYALFTPSWDTSGNYATVAVTAYGAKRRLAQAITPVVSVLTRSLPTLPNLEQYWPCEDGSTAQSFVSGISGGVTMFYNGVPQLASNSSAIASNPLPVLGSGSFSASFTTQATGQVSVQAIWAFAAAASASPNNSVMLRLFCSGTLSRVDLQYDTGGAITVVAYNNSGAQVYTSGPVGFSLDGGIFRGGFSLVQTAPNVVAWHFDMFKQNGSQGGFSTNISGSQTFTGLTGLSVAPNGDQTNLVMGQITVQNIYSGTIADQSQVNAYKGEYTGARLDRLATENGEYLTRLANATNQFMGPQTPDIFLNLMQGCSDVELGYLYDGVSQGLSFIAQDQISSLPAAMTLDASLGQPAQPLTPVDDDYLTINQFTAARTSGSSYTYVDTVDALSVASIGEYAQNVTLPFYQDGEQLSDYASWKVNTGTIGGYRWTPLMMWLHRNPELLAAWLAAGVMSRVDIINLNTARSQFSSNPESTLVQGYTEVIDQFLYTVSANTSPYAPWRVGEFAADTGDTNPYLLRADTDGSTITQAYAAGATSIQIATVAGMPVWTTVADDCPLQINVQGYPVTVTAITGATSPQTFTVSALPTAVPANASTSLWQPCLLDVIGF